MMFGFVTVFFDEAKPGGNLAIGCFVQGPAVQMRPVGSFRWVSGTCNQVYRWYRARCAVLFGAYDAAIRAKAWMVRPTLELNRYQRRSTANGRSVANLTPQRLLYA